MALLIGSATAAAWLKRTIGHEMQGKAVAAVLCRLAVPFRRPYLIAEKEEGQEERDERED